MAFVFTCASASSHTSRRASEHSAAQSRKLDRNPWGTAPIPRSRTSFEIATSESGPPRAEGNHHHRAIGERLRLLEHRQRPPGQRNPVLPPRLHPLRWNAPFPTLKVHLLPQRAAHLPAPARRQHQELERQHGRGIRPGHPHRLDRPTHLRIRQRRVMPGPDAVVGQRRPDGLARRVVFPVALRHRIPASPPRSDAESAAPSPASGSRSVAGPPSRPPSGSGPPPSPRASALHSPGGSNATASPACRRSSTCAGRSHP